LVHPVCVPHIAASNDTVDLVKDGGVDCVDPQEPAVVADPSGFREFTVCTWGAAAPWSENKIGWPFTEHRMHFGEKFI
jgi:hypothetical protein